MLWLLKAVTASRQKGNRFPPTQMGLWIMPWGLVTMWHLTFALIVCVQQRQINTYHIHTIPSLFQGPTELLPLKVRSGRYSHACYGINSSKVQVLSDTHHSRSVQVLPSPSQRDHLCIFDAQVCVIEFCYQERDCQTMTQLNNNTSDLLPDIV